MGKKTKGTSECTIMFRAPFQVPSGSDISWAPGIEWRRACKRASATAYCNCMSPLRACPALWRVWMQREAARGSWRGGNGAWQRRDFDRVSLRCLAVASHLMHMVRARVRGICAHLLFIFGVAPSATVRAVVSLRGAAAYALVSRCARVELGPRCDLGVRQHLGPTGGLVLR